MARWRVGAAEAVGKWRYFRGTKHSRRAAAGRRAKGGGGGGGWLVGCCIAGMEASAGRPNFGR